MLSLNMTPSNDNTAIWIIKITSGTRVYRFSTESVSLIANDTSNKLYDGTVLGYNTLSKLHSLIDISKGGNIGQVGNVSFGLRRYTKNQFFSNFFNELYPNTDEYISAADIEIGIIWSGAILESQITWIASYSITSHPYDQNMMFVNCIEKIQYESKLLPPYKVNNIGHEIIWVPDSKTKDFLNSVIPIVYGDYSPRTHYYNEAEVTPALLIRKGNNTYIGTCHKCFAFTDQLINSYNQEWDTLLVLSDSITPGGFVTSNTEQGVSITNNSDFFAVHAAVKMNLPNNTTNTEALYENISDGDTSTYADLTSSDVLEVTFDSKNSLAGESSDLSEAYIYLLLQGSGAGNIDVTLTYLNPYPHQVTKAWTMNQPFSATESELLIDITPYMITQPYGFIGDDGNKYAFTPSWDHLLSISIKVVNKSAGTTVNIKELRVIFDDFVFNGINKDIKSFKDLTKNGDYLDRDYPGFKKKFGDVKGNLSNIFFNVRGMMFSRWIDTVNGSIRDNGFNANGVINTFSYIIESIIRDWVLCERNLRVTAKSGTVITCNSLLSSEDDYYNGAVYINPLSNHRTYVTDYVGSTKQLTLAVADPTATNNINPAFYLTNIQGDNKIDYASFDACGNTTDGVRKAWYARRCLDTETKSEDILSQLLYESACILVRDNKYKLIPLDEAAAGDTWDTCLFSQEERQYVFTLDYTDINGIATSFILNYNYDNARRMYRNQIYVNAQGYSAGAGLSSIEQTKCLNAEKNYRLQNKTYEYNSDYIYDITTAGKLLKKIVNSMTNLKPIITIGQPLKTHIKYEVGDQVKLNLPKLIPAALNNSRYFIITGKQIEPNPGAPNVYFNLTLADGI